MLLPTAVAEVVQQKCEHAEAVEDPIAMGAQEPTCINSILECRPCKTPVKTRIIRLLNFRQLSSP